MNGPGGHQGVCPVQEQASRSFTGGHNIIWAHRPPGGSRALAGPPTHSISFQCLSGGLLPKCLWGAVLHKEEVRAVYQVNATSLLYPGCLYCPIQPFQRGQIHCSISLELNWTCVFYYTTDWHTTHCTLAHCTYLHTAHTAHCTLAHWQTGKLANWHTLHTLHTGRLAHWPTLHTGLGVYRLEPMIGAMGWDRLTRFLVRY